MKVLVITLLAGISTLTSIAVGVQPQDDDENAIRETIQLYFKGDRNRDVEFLRKAFHSTARLLTSDENGNLSVLTQTEWYKRVRQTPDREKPAVKILHIDRTGNAAAAKTQMTLSNGTYTDFLSLLKIDGHWIIVNKVYHWQER